MIPRSRDRQATRPASGAVPVVLAISLAACGQGDDVGRRRGCGDGGGPCPAVDAGPPVCPDRPPVAAPDGERWYRRGLCACDGFTLSAPVSVDAFDSRQGPYAGPAGEATAGIGGRLAANGALRVQGALTVGTAVQGSPQPLVMNALTVGGPVATDGDLSVFGDARIAGDLRAATLRVDGRLTQPADARRTTTTETIGEVSAAAVAVTPPCTCAELDVAARVAAVTSDSDPDALAAVEGPVTLALPCGVYRYRRIAGRGDLTLALSGPTAMYVTDDIALRRLAVELEPAATFDLYVAGGWVVSDSVAIGDPDRPDAVRVFVGTRGTVNLGGGGQFAGRWVAKDAELVNAGRLEVFGSLFFRRISSSATVDLHQDLAPAAVR